MAFDTAHGLVTTVGDDWHVQGESIVVFVDAPELGGNECYQCTFAAEWTRDVVLGHGSRRMVSSYDVGECGFRIFDSATAETRACDLNDATRMGEVETVARRAAERVAEEWTEARS